jgi:cytochrome d ubiquinol oxidase subunit I
MTDFWQTVFTPSFIPRLLHVWVASWTMGSALLLSVGAWYLLKKRHLDLAKSMIVVALPFFVVFAILNVTVSGSDQASEVVTNQPIKLASMEGLWESQSCAPAFVVGWVDEAARTTTGISIPCLLSFLAFRDPNATVQGIDAFPNDPLPPINLVFQAYHAMVGLGFLFVPIALLAVLLFFWKRRLWESRWMQWILVVTVVLAGASITAGWWTAEIGRQPWIVYNVLETSKAISPVVGGVDVLASLVMFIVLYLILFVLFIYLLNAKIQAGPEPLEAVETVSVSSLPDTFRDIFRRQPRAG